MRLDYIDRIRDPKFRFCAVITIRVLLNEIGQGVGMPELSLYGRKVNSVFQLLGEKENDLTYSLAWGLAKSRPFLKGFLELVDAHQAPHDSLSISIQQHDKDAGFPDIEIRSNDYDIIVEAKRGWNLPGSQQLEKYAGTLTPIGYEYFPANSLV